MENNIKLRQGDARYLAAYFDTRDTDPVAIEPWMSTICAECGVNAQSSPYPHTLDDAGMVLICCEGYHQVNPNVLGINSPNWMDWHEEMGNLEPSPFNPCRHCGQSVGECRTRKGLEMPNCCGLCNHGEE